MTINYLGNYFAPRGSKNPTGASNTAKAKTEGVPIADVDDVDRSPFHNDHDAAVGGDLTVPSEGMNNNNNNNSKRSHPSLSTSSSSSSSSSILLRDKNNKTTKHESSTLFLSSSSNSSSNDSNTWTVTPISLLLRTMGYMDNDTLMMMCLVCKQINELIKTGEGMERQLIRVFELRPSGDNNYCSMKRIELFHSNMNRYWQDGTKRRMLQGYQRMKIYDPPKMLAFYNSFEELERLVPPHLRMTGIVDLDISSPVPNRNFNNCALVQLALLVPNLRTLDISNLDPSRYELIKLSQRCPHIEILKWNNSDGFPADGECLTSIKNLKELYLDGGTFLFNADNDEIDDGNDVSEERGMADMENYPNIFFFHKLCKKNPLERVSIRHARSCCSFERYIAAQFDPIAQNILIKFVRNAPSTLVWFQSDLSTENIRMLQSERPGIQLVN